MRKILASLDLGSSHIKLIVAEVLKGRLNVLTSVSVYSRGVKQGFIVNHESAKEALKDALTKVEEKLNIEIKKLLLAIPNYDVECFFEKDSINIKGEDLRVSEKDIKLLTKKIRDSRVDTNTECVCFYHIKYYINDTEVDNPLGKEGERLDLEGVYVSVPKNNLVGLKSLLKDLDIEVIDYTIGPIADFMEFKNQYNLKDVGVVINIGFTKTEVSVFNKEILTATATIDAGVLNIIRDISYVKKIKEEISLDLFFKLALASKDSADVDEFLEVSNNQGEVIKINQYELSEIVSSRLEEIANLIKKEINTLTKREISYIMFTGGLTELKDFQLFVDKHFQNNAFIGEISELGIRNNQYSTAAGVIKNFNEKLKRENKQISVLTKQEEEELSGKYKKINIKDGSILGKLFGHFFDN